MKKICTIFCTIFFAFGLKKGQILFATKPLEYHQDCSFFLFAESQYNSRYQQWIRPFPWFAYLERENDIRKKSRKGYISNSVTGIGKEKRLVHLAWLGVQQEVCFYKKLYEILT